MRMFCQPDNKASLKNQPRGALYQIDERRQPRLINSDVVNASRHLSLDRHEHRLRFMM